MLPDTSRRLNRSLLLSEEPTLEPFTVSVTVTFLLLLAGTVSSFLLNLTVALLDWLVAWFDSEKMTRLEPLFTKVIVLL